MRTFLGYIFAAAFAIAAVSGALLWHDGFFEHDVEIAAPAHAAYVSDGKVPLPSRIIIPKIKVNAAIEQVGITAKNAMANPSSFSTVGWYKYGPRPGELGGAVLDGHLDNALALSGVFKHLGDLTVGDEIDILGKNGTTTLQFRVIKTETLPYNLTDKVQLDAIFDAPYTSSSLRIITCAGSWVRSAKSYDKRLLVTAEFISEKAGT